MNNSYYKVISCEDDKIYFEAIAQNGNNATLDSIAEFVFKKFAKRQNMKWMKSNKFNSIREGTDLIICKQFEIEYQIELS